MKVRAIGLGIIALLILVVAYCYPEGSSQTSTGESMSPASSSSFSDDSKTSNQRRGAVQNQNSQQELAKQFIIEADKIIAEKRMTFGVLVMYSLSDNVEQLSEQMNHDTVLQLLDHYQNWDQDVYVCGICCHLLQRLAELAPEEALALYDKKIGLSKVTAILRLSDEEEEVDLEKNAKAIPTLSLMALASGYQIGKPGSRSLFQAFKKTIPWNEIARAMAEDEEQLVGESGMLCLMLFCGMLAEECKLQPDFALAEWRALPLGEPLKINILGSLTQDDEIPFRILQNDVESVLQKDGTINDERKELALSFAKRIFEESPDEAAQWLAQHKLPLEDRSASELDSLLVSWTPETHASYLAWSNQLDDNLRSRIAVQKMERLCMSLANSQTSTSEVPREYDMLDSLLSDVPSAQRLLLMTNVAKQHHAENDASFRELLQHLNFSKADVQSLLEEKNKSE